MILTKWLAHHPRFCALLYFPLFPILLIVGVVIEEGPAAWDELKDAYKEWPRNMYESCERQREKYAREEQP